jgi:hypothetical protein
MRDDMEQMMKQEIIVSRPNEETRDRGTLRLGDCLVSFEAPTLRRPDEKTRDRGTVRLGDCLIAARY